MVFLHTLDRFGIRRHLCALGERSIGDFLAEGVRQGDDLARLIDRLRRYERCSPELLRAIGGDRFAPRLSVVSR